MNVLIADKFEERGIKALREFGCDVSCDASLQADSLRQAIVDTKCEVLIVRSTRVTADMLEASDALGLVVRAGAGYNTIDVATAASRSIRVANCPGKNSVAVAELTLGLILALDRRLVHNTNDLLAGRWNKKEYGKAKGLKGRTLGILGMGQIGRAVAKRAQAFDMNVTAWSRSLTKEAASELGIAFAATPAEVAKTCDVLSIHLAATPDTKLLVDAQLLNLLKPGSYVINTSRANVLDYEALASAVQDRQLRVGLDVYPAEPGAGDKDFTDPIMSVDGVIYGTHHIGASTDQAQDAIADEAVRIVKHYQETGRVANCVNLRHESPATCTLQVRHLNKPGVLAFVLRELAELGLNVEEMENIICEGGTGACAHVLIDGTLDATSLDRMREGHEGILAIAQSRLQR